MNTEIKNYSIDDAINSQLQYQVNQSAIAFSKKMIEEGLAEDNISKVQHYTEMWCRYTDRQLSIRYEKFRADAQREKDIL